MNLTPRHWQRIACAAAVIGILIGIVQIRDQSRTTPEMTFWARVGTDAVLTAIVIGPGLLTAFCINKLGIIFPLRRKQRLREAKLEHIKRRTITIENRRANVEHAADRAERIRAAYLDTYRQRSAQLGNDPDNGGS